MEIFVLYSFGGHDALWFKYDPTTKLTLAELYADALGRWNPKNGKLKSLIVLKQTNPAHISKEDEFCGFDTRPEPNTLKYFLQYGLQQIPIS